MSEFQDIATARFVEGGTVADLKMSDGSICRAIWAERGRTTAWWPLTGRRKRWIGLYDPIAWRRVQNIVGLRK
jgi:hypothetical protein